MYTFSGPVYSKKKDVRAGIPHFLGKKRMPFWHSKEDIQIGYMGNEGDVLPSAAAVLAAGPAAAASAAETAAAEQQQQG